MENEQDLIRSMLAYVGLSEGWDINLLGDTDNKHYILSLKRTISPDTFASSESFKSAILPVIDSVLDSPAMNEDVRPLINETQNLRSEVAHLRAELTEVLRYKTHYDLQMALNHGKKD